MTVNPILRSQQQNCTTYVLLVFCNLQAGRWFQQLLAGVLYLHSNGVAHRDLKLVGTSRWTGCFVPVGHVVERKLSSSICVVRVLQLFPVVLVLFSTSRG